MGAPVAVGTIDQAMLSQMKVRHGHLRAWCLARHLLVIDEVHASDPYMSEIVSRLSPPASTAPVPSACSRRREVPSSPC
jgi:hypothetical protein